MSLSEDLKKGGSRHAASRVRSVKSLESWRESRSACSRDGKGTKAAWAKGPRTVRLVGGPWGFTEVDLSVDPGFRCEWNRNS